jgi:flavin-dependent dehydrogenase
MQECIIIGGGVAGLAASIRLAELGITSSIIEAGSYPAHKVCGEFLSPECLYQLLQWGIQPIAISQTHLHHSQQTLNFQFPQAAGGLSHLKLDPQLVQKAQSLGVNICPNTSVKNIFPKSEKTSTHTIELTTGETLITPSLIVATGRIPSYNRPPPTFTYMGIKAHFKEIPFKGSLEMFSFPGAYLGIAPIEDDKYNVACLAHLAAVKESGNAKNLMYTMMSQSPLLQTYLSEGKNLFSEWMTTSVPEFGLKSTPKWKDAYFIGDAALTIPPASGSGLSLALLGGCLVAEAIKQQKGQIFQKEWQKCCSKQLFWAKLLHQALMCPHLSSPLVWLSKKVPSLAHYAFQLTRQSPY